MSLRARLRHSIAIERMTPGAEDERGQPAVTWSVLATVRGWLQPKPKKSSEADQVSEAGSTVVLATVWMLPTDVRTGDRVRRVDTAETYYVTAIEDPAGKGHHLELAVERRVAAPALGAV